MGLFEPYAFQNVYLITTYRCNWECQFCLFRFNKEVEAPIDEYIQKLEYAILDSPKKVYIKITGGEPFIKTALLKEIFKVANKYHDKVYKIGIGSNGSIQLPKFFNDVNIKTHIFLSRHNVKDKLPLPSDLAKNISNPMIDFRTNCNLIKGGVDSVEKIEQYVKDRYLSSGITHFCFRELSKVEINSNLIYPKQIHDYIEYYDNHLILVSDIETQIKTIPQFRRSRTTGNYYDINKWYWYEYNNNKVSIKFRTIDETKLISFNKDVDPDRVDEYVVHPDGTLTGCWDKELKLIVKGGKTIMPSRPYIPKPIPKR